MDKDKQRCGFVAVIGAPNAGKSTLVNYLVGTKVSIVSSKVQTTRSLVRGIALYENSQIIFIDTPGIFTPKKRLERSMVAAAWQGKAEAEIVMLVVDASRKRLDVDTEDIINELAENHVEGVAVLLVLNKVDKMNPEKLLVLSEQLNDRFAFEATYMVSALKGRGLKDLKRPLASRVPEGVWMYPEEQVSDMPARLLAAEITREKLFTYLHQELPYGLAVETENWEVFKNGSVKIDQVIYVSREAHKGIVLGKGGSMVKRVGEAARLELEEIMEQSIHLKLFVKVNEGWMDDPERYKLWGLDYSS